MPIVFALMLSFLLSPLFGDDNPYVRLILESNRLLCAGDYARYLEFYDDDSITKEAVISNVKKLESLKGTLQKMKGALTKLVDIGNDDDYAVYKGHQKLEITVIVDGRTNTVTQEMDVVYIIRKKASKICGFCSSKPTVIPGD